MLGSEPSAGDRLEYRRLAEAIPALIWLTNAEGETLYANRRWTDFTGNDIAGLKSGEIFTLIHPDDVARVRAAWERVADGSGTIDVEYRLKTREGGYRWILAHAIPLRDDEGRLSQWLGAGIDIQEIKSSSEYTQRVMAAVPQIVFISNLQGGAEYYNRRWFEITGLTPEESLGEGWIKGVHPDDVRKLEDVGIHARERGEPFFAEYRIRRASDNTYRWHMVTAQPIRDAGGAIARWIGVATDIDDQKRREAVLRYLADASELLGESFDVERRLQALAERSVPEFADWCGIYLLRDNFLEPVAISHRNPEQVRIAQQLLREYPVEVTDRALEFLRAGKAMFMPIIPESALEQAARDARHLSLMQQLEMRSSIQVPLTINQQNFGFIHFVNGPSGRVYDASDVQTVEILAKRISIAIDNARIYERERRVANTFQQAALPRTLPELPGVSLSAFYQPAMTEAEIGGDWYDAFTLDGKQLILSIGDVSGKGLEAAVMMSSVRQAIRVAALEGLDVRRIVAAADKALQLEYPGRIVTALVAIVELDTLNVSYSNAGQPPALLRNHADDVAILSVAFGRSRHWSLDANDAVRAQSARSSFLRHLEEEGTGDSDFASAELIFGELVGNVVRYSPGRVDIDLEWNGSRPTLHVIDRGEEFTLRPLLPEDILSENGRGLFIVRTLGEDLRVRPVPGGGNHVSVRLPVERQKTH